MKTIILAAGNQKRFGSGRRIKQLMPIFDNTTIIDRVVSLAKIYDSDPIIISNKRETFERVGVEQIVVPYYERRCTCQSLRYGINWLRDNTDDQEICCLLGDVIYSSPAAHDIMGFEYTMPTFFISNDGQEIFAIRFYLHDVLFYDSIDSAIRYFFRGKGKGKLWNAYYNYHGIPSAPHKVMPKNTFIVNDWTTDIDTMQQYNDFMATINNRFYEQANF